jgi:hypothetical protein
MARVNIETQAFIDARIVDDLMEWEEGTALGKLAFIWQDSQDKALTHASGRELCRWARIRAERREEFLNALREGEFISLSNEGSDALTHRYEIHGNDSQIESLAKHKAKTSKGGEMTKRRWAEWRSKQSGNATSYATSPLQADSQAHSEQARKPAPTGPIAVAVALQKNKDKEKDSCTEHEADASELGAASELGSDPKVAKVLADRKVSAKTQLSWLDAYPDTRWIQQEILKAVAWETANPKKKKRHFARFMGGWLSRGWDKYTAKLPNSAINTKPLSPEELTT